MASGSFNLESDISTLKGKIEWSSTSNGSAANTSTVTATLYVARTDTYTTTGTWEYGLNVGGAIDENSKSASVSSSWVEMKTITQTVAHNPDGTGTCYIEGYCIGPAGTSMANHSVTGAATVTLDRIPRYTSITSFTVSKRNETSVTYNFTMADTCDYVWYSTNNGSSWTGVDITDGKSGNFNVTGLSPNTTYNFKLRVRRKDSQLTTDSSTVRQTTYKVPTQSLSSKTETSITMSWSVDSTADYIWYSTNNGSNWTAVGSVNATSGSYTISGLSANTSYNIKTRVRRKAPQTTYDTATLNVTTYNYPYVSVVGTTALTIGNSQTLTLYNPLSRSVTVKMYQNNTSGTQLYSGTTSGTSITFTPTANTLYASIPNSQSGNCVYSVIYGNSTKTTGTYTYKIIGNETPTFSDFTYADTNSTTTALTGNNQIFVSGYSNVTATISTENKAVAKNNASMNNYVLSIGNQSTQANYSASSDVTLSINKVTNNSIKVTANDSRGLATAVTKTATIKNYIKPAITSMSVTRSNNGVGETVTLEFEGIWWNDNFGSVANAIQTVQYYYRKSTTNTWTTGTTTITFTTNQNRFSGNLVIEGDTSTLGFDVTSSYFIKIKATDRLDTSEEYQATLGSGTPAMAIYKDNVAIGQQYDTDEGSKLQVNGRGIFYGTTSFADPKTSTNTVEGGEIHLLAPHSASDKAGTTIDNYNSTLRIFGIQSADGTSKSGVGTPFTIDPYAKTITGGYTITGSLSGTATNAQYLKAPADTGFNSDQYGNFKHKRSNIDDNWQFQNSAGTVKAQYYWETGTWNANITKLESPSTRITNANVTHIYDNSKVHQQVYIASSSMTSNKPASNGYIQHFCWDTSGNWDAQLYIPSESDLPPIQHRMCLGGTWTSWESVWRCKNLYNNTSGTTGNVTLSETSANFDYLEIFYKDSTNGRYGSTKIVNPNGKGFNMQYAEFGTGTGTAVLFGRTFSISGTTLTATNNFGRMGLSDGSAVHENRFQIIRVDGYR